MERYNILNKPGYLTDEDRKQPLDHGGNWVNFKSCIDLSQGVKVTPWGNTKKLTIDQYSEDLAGFMVWWTLNVLEDLNGYSGMSHVKFDIGDVEIINPNTYEEAE